MIILYFYKFFFSYFNNYFRIVILNYKKFQINLNIYQNLIFLFQPYLYLYIKIFYVTFQNHFQIWEDL